jgi:hypothetical protein
MLWGVQPAFEERSLHSEPNADFHQIVDMPHRSSFRGPAAGAGTSRLRGFGYVREFDMEPRLTRAEQTPRPTLWSRARPI